MWRARNDRLPFCQLRPAAVPRAAVLPADRIPGLLFAGRHRTALRLHRDWTRPVSGQPVPGAATADLRDHAERHAAGDPVLHADGHHPRTQRHGRGSAGNRRPGIRARARRPGDRRDPGRRAAGRHHRRRRGSGHQHGPDFAADHAALRLQPHHRHRHNHRFGHAGAGDSAIAGADRAGRPARPLGWRHVRRRAGAGPAAGRPVPVLCRSGRGLQALMGAGAAARGTDLPRGQRRERPSVAAGAAGHLHGRRLCVVDGARGHHQSDGRSRSGCPR